RDMLFASLVRPPPRSTPFPTRRSSDLGPVPKQGRGACHSPHCFSHGTPLVAGGPPAQPVLAGGRAGYRARHPDALGRQQGPPDRSEEHTSELQSRENLVCRLLLEKKNT